MEKFKEYAALVWSKYKVIVAKYPVRSPLVALVIGAALGYWVGGWGG